MYLPHIGAAVARARAESEQQCAAHTSAHARALFQIAALGAAAEREKARLVTTAKDAARLRPEARNGIEVLDVRIDWRDQPTVSALLARVLQARGTASG